MALTKISGNVVQQNNFSLSGVVTATSFTGDLTGNVTGNVTGTATTATNLADGANITTGTISNDRLPSTITKNLTGDVTGNLTGNVTGNVTGTATTATNLADGANITTGTISNDRLPSTITKNLTGDVTGNLTGNVSSSGANTLGSLTVTNDATVGGALTVTGNLTVNGTTTTIDTVVTAIDSLAVDGDVTAGGNLDITGVSTFKGTTEVKNASFKVTNSSAAGQYLQVTQNNNSSLNLDKVGDGAFYIRGNNIYLQNDGTSETYAGFEANGKSYLNYDGSTKLETTGTGVTITGDARVTGILTVGQSSVTIDGTNNKITTPKLDYAGISSSISDTAVDVFVYDTRKDSDGGAWRKRTQHTSWYNETLNTATRGSRREFPAVAVIVVTANEIIIYDGDDPDLPMWMVFNSDSDSNITNGMSSRDFTGVSAVNGWIMVSRQSTLGVTALVYVQINFIFDGAEQILAETSSGSHYQVYNGGIGERNGAKGYTGIDNSLELINADTDAWDVASTVLPNAPIDERTGLPTPTVAVATSDGVSIIKDDRSVVDYIHQNSTYDVTSFVEFLPDNRVAYAWDSNDTPRRLYITPILSADTQTVNVSSYPIDSVGSVGYGEPTDNKDVGNYHGHLIGSDQSVAAGMNGSMIAVGDGSDGLNLVDVQGAGDDTFNSLVAFATTSYNTGWMHGDIKGAFLSDTDATNATYTTVADDWATASAWTKQSSITLTSTGSGTSGTVTITGNGTGSNVYFFNPITVEANTDYVVTVTFGAYNANAFHINNTQYSNLGTKLDIGSLSGLTKGGHFNSGSDTTLYIQGWQQSTTATTITDIVIQKVSEKDRSVNNKGLQVFGTITKSAVATGADLVAYRPPSGTLGDNYLSRPLTSSDFDLTSDWSITFWAKRNEQDADNYSGFEIAEDDLTGNVSYAKIPFSIYIDISGNTGWRGTGVTGYQYNTLFDTQDVWKCVTTISKSGNLYIYVNGEYVTSTPATFTNPSNPYSLGIFRFSYSTSRHDGRRHIDYALFRMSNSAPSAEQIKKIYEDEKVLFQENAACTLYGSSDAVTALAYDDSTNILYAGTSSGRSDFQGLRRINNTTTAVTTAMSASNGLVAEQ